VIFSTITHAALPEIFAPSEYATPTECPAYYGINKRTGACDAISDKIKDLTKSECNSPGLKFEAKCVPDSEKPPVPACKAIFGYAANIIGAGANAQCSFERTNPTSAPGDYVGDCFEIKAVPDATKLESGKNYFVSSQKNLDSDRELTLIPGNVGFSFDLNWDGSLGCTPTAGTQIRVMASKLHEAGASRKGYAYGFLTMPYKYFPSKKSFLVNVPIGAFLGWREGQAGSGYTYAVAITLSSVKANTVDPGKIDAAGKPSVTGTADVTALSYAAGLIFDILKSPTGKPFKAGVFVGRDVVNDEPSVEYGFNRKTWIAIQIGYDFTEN